ncbi:hypothetical protein Thini_4491 [Thiothrix nivea DSM 5205]|uniref:Uncharacterized protein n=2 Tax=Thiothrix nivea TaxID=1031 RepID=A0A656HPI2_THINJ|nr:hypothetical protein Thini_4491 [Thiothrix nivea DSM 5205]
MTRLIESIEEIQDKLTFSLSVDIRTELLLEEIKTGSLLTWLSAETTYPENKPEIKIDKNNNKKINNYLQRGIEKIVDFTSRRDKINSIKEINDLQDDLYNMASDTDIKNIPAYSKIAEKDIMEFLLKTNEASKTLSKDDEIFFIFDNGAKKYNKEFSITKESIEELLIQSQKEDLEFLELKIKKPDYIGDSKWEFMYDDKIIDVKVDDHNWLKKFRNQEFALRPGDSLLALVMVKKFYNHNSELIKTTYRLDEVRKIIRQPSPLKNMELNLNNEQERY